MKKWIVVRAELIRLMTHVRNTMLSAFCISMISIFVLAPVGVANAGGENFGKPGDPIHLVVGYQPYATLTWDGAVLRKKEYWKKYLPSGSTVTFQIGLQGAIIVNQMLAGKQQVGWLSATPAIIASTKQNVADIRLVGVVDQDNLCNIALVRANAPQFKNSKEALQWLNGKTIAVPQGSCADLFGRSVLKRENIKPAAYLNQSLEVIASGYRAGKLDGSFQWEPTTAKLVQEGLARVVAYGEEFGASDSCYIVMRADLIKQRPDVVKAMLNAELDAQLFMADPKNANELVDIVAEQITGFTKKVLWHSLYGSYPMIQYKSNVRMNLPFIFTPSVMANIKESAVFLHSINAINTSNLRSDAVMDEFAQQVLKERGLKSPIGAIHALPDSELRGN